jgi:hypothetical protein
VPNQLVRCFEGIRISDDRFEFFCVAVDKGLESGPDAGHQGWNFFRFDLLDVTFLNQKGDREIVAKVIDQIHMFLRHRKIRVPILYNLPKQDAKKRGNLHLWFLAYDGNVKSMLTEC